MSQIFASYVSSSPSPIRPVHTNGEETLTRQLSTSRQMGDVLCSLTHISKPCHLGRTFLPCSRLTWYLLEENIPLHSYPPIMLFVAASLLVAGTLVLCQFRPSESIERYYVPHTVLGVWHCRIALFPVSGICRRPRNGNEHSECLL